MSIHISQRRSIRFIRQISLCLVLLVSFGTVASSPQPQSPLQENTILPSPNLSITPFMNRSLSIDQWFEQARLVPSITTPMMSFGYSVAMDGDTVVVGAYWHHIPQTGGGAAYVFVKPAAGWPGITQVAKLSASDIAFHDQFGWSVAISGNTIVVGSIYHNDPGTYNTGRAYVFVKPDGGWTDMTETAKLTASDIQNSDEFGRDVAIDGDTIVVGVPFDDVEVNADQGSVYVFQKPPGGWISATETAKLTASDGLPGDMLGYSVDISGDTIVTGSYAHNHGAGVGEGQAYIFNQSGGWISGTENARLTALDSFDHEYFGFSVAIDGNLVVVGAPGENTFDGSGSDSAYVFIRPVAGWIGDLNEDAILSASDGDISDDFANSVAASGDVVVVGAPLDDIGDEGDQGSAYVYSKPESGWSAMTETDKLTASNGVDTDLFGTSVSIRNNTIVVGAPKHSLSDNDDIGT
ncbi:MAG TPA: FG-GAP repeat protein, partial [Anaerolineales bacterium]|nr:FG-GAP repeat protein [Anaerolineales bacterium]